MKFRDVYDGPLSLVASKLQFCLSVSPTLLDWQTGSFVFGLSALIFASFIDLFIYLQLRNLKISRGEITLGVLASLFFGSPFWQILVPQVLAAASIALNFQTSLSSSETASSSSCCFLLGLFPDNANLQMSLGHKVALNTGLTSMGFLSLQHLGCLHLAWLGCSLVLLNSSFFFF